MKGGGRGKGDRGRTWMEGGREEVEGVGGGGGNEVEGGSWRGRGRR